MDSNKKARRTGCGLSGFVAFYEPKATTALLLIEVPSSMKECCFGCLSSKSCANVEKKREKPLFRGFLCQCLTLMLGFFILWPA